MYAAVLRIIYSLERAFKAKHNRTASHCVVHNHECPSCQSFDNHGEPHLLVDPDHCTSICNQQQEHRSVYGLRPLELRKKSIRT